MSTKFKVKTVELSGRIVSDRSLTVREIAQEVHHIQEQDRIPVSRVVLRQIGLLAT